MTKRWASSVGRSIVDAGEFIRAFGDIQTPLETAIAATGRWYQARATA